MVVHQATRCLGGGHWSACGPGNGCCQTSASALDFSQLITQLNNWSADAPMAAVHYPPKEQMAALPDAHVYKYTVGLLEGDGTIILDQQMEPNGRIHSQCAAARHPSTVGSPTHALCLGSTPVCSPWLALGIHHHWNSSVLCGCRCRLRSSPLLDLTTFLGSRSA